MCTAVFQDADDMCFFSGAYKNKNQLVNFIKCLKIFTKKQPVWNLSQIKNSNLKTKKFAKNRKKDAIVANLQLFKQHHFLSWTQLAPKINAIRGHKNNFSHEKSHRKKKEKNFSSRKQKRKRKLIPRSHGVVSLSLSLAFESIGTNKLREGQLVLNFINFLSLFLSLNFVEFYGIYGSVIFRRPQNQNLKFLEITKNELWFKKRFVETSIIIQRVFKKNSRIFLGILEGKYPELRKIRVSFHAGWHFSNTNLSFDNNLRVLCSFGCHFLRPISAFIKFFQHFLISQKSLKIKKYYFCARTL